MIYPNPNLPTIVLIECPHYLDQSSEEIGNDSASNPKIAVQTPIYQHTLKSGE